MWVENKFRHKFLACSVISFVFFIVFFKIVFLPWHLPWEPHRFSSFFFIIRNKKIFISSRSDETPCYTCILIFCCKRLLDTGLFWNEICNFDFVCLLQNSRSFLWILCLRSCLILQLREILQHRATNLVIFSSLLFIIIFHSISHYTCIIEWESTMNLFPLFLPDVEWSKRMKIYPLQLLELQIIYIYYLKIGGNNGLTDRLSVWFI